MTKKRKVYVSITLLGKLFAVFANFLGHKLYAVLLALRTWGTHKETKAGWATAESQIGQLLEEKCSRRGGHVCDFIYKQSGIRSVSFVAILEKTKHSRPRVYECACFRPHRQDKGTRKIEQ